MTDLKSEGRALSLLPRLLADGWSREGAPLPAALRARMEALFGTSFASVTIHTGPEPASVGATAFAFGERLYFAPGVFDPATGAGEDVLVHELVHVVQQRQSRAAGLPGQVAILDDPALEAEAEAIADGVRRPDGTAARPLAAGEATVIQRITYRDQKQNLILNEQGKASKFRSGGNGAITGAEMILKLLITEYNQTQGQLDSAKGGLGRLTNYGRVQALRRRLEALGREIQNKRIFFERQGFKLMPDGSIDWPNSQTVVSYDTSLAQQGMTRLIGKGGKLCWESTGTPASTENLVSFFSGNGYAIYVMSGSGKIHMHAHSIGQYHHSSLLNGGNVAGAGEMKVAADGTLMSISNKSGHYKPSSLHLSQVLHQLTKMGIPQTYSVTEWSSPTKKELMPAGVYLEKSDMNHDYELIRLMGYSLSFTDPTLPARAGMQWQPAPEPGFYSVTSGQKLPHRVARKKLKELGFQPNGVFLGDSHSLAQIPNPMPNVMPGPMNNAATGNAYAYSPSGNAQMVYLNGSSGGYNSYARTGKDTG